MWYNLNIMFNIKSYIILFDVTCSVFPVCNKQMDTYYHLQMFVSVLGSWVLRLASLYKKKKYTSNFTINLLSNVYLFLSNTCPSICIMVGNGTNSSNICHCLYRLFLRWLWSSVMMGWKTLTLRVWPRPLLTIMQHCIRSSKLAVSST